MARLIILDSLASPVIVAMVQTSGWPVLPIGFDPTARGRA